MLRTTWEIVSAGRPQRARGHRLIGQWVRSDLEFYEIPRFDGTSLDVPGSVGTVGSVDPSSLPATVRVVDAAVDPAAVEPVRVGYPHHNPLAGLGEKR